MTLTYMVKHRRYPACWGFDFGRELPVDGYRLQLVDSELQLSLLDSDRNVLERQALPLERLVQELLEGKGVLELMALREEIDQLVGCREATGRDLAGRRRRAG